LALGKYGAGSNLEKVLESGKEDRIPQVGGNCEAPHNSTVNRLICWRTHSRIVTAKVHGKGVKRLQQGRGRLLVQEKERDWKPKLSSEERQHVEVVPSIKMRGKDSPV